MHLIFWTSLMVGIICLTTAALDSLGNSQWAPIGFIIATFCFWIAWMTYPWN